MASSGYYNCRVTVELGHVQTFQCIAAERSRVRGEQKAKRGNGEFHMRKGLNEELKEDWIWGIYGEMEHKGIYNEA